MSGGIYGHISTPITYNIDKYQVNTFTDMDDSDLEITTETSSDGSQVIQTIDLKQKVKDKIKAGLKVSASTEENTGLIGLSFANIE